VNHTSLLESFLLASFSGTVDCSLVILCFISSIHLRIGTWSNSHQSDFIQPLVETDVQTQSVTLEHS
ncbi:hypothetical protein STEG23_001750, partial [Scotinomys teguina]